MTLTCRSSYLLCCAALLLSGCVSTQLLGDPGATEGGSGGAETGGSVTAGEATSTASGSTAGGSDATGDPSAPTITTTTPDPETGSSSAGETAGGDSCAQWTPPPFDCPEQGESRAGLETAALDGFEFGESIPCEVIALASDAIDRWLVRLQCDDGFVEFTYVSAAPYVDPPVDIGTQVLYTGVVFEQSPEFAPSVALHTPDGELLLAFVDHYQMHEPPPIDLAPLEIAYGGTGCPSFPNLEDVLCNEDPLSAVAMARVSVSIEGDDSLEIADGNSGIVNAAGRTYRVTVGEASQIVCWDDSCQGEEAGPFDHLRMLVVAEL